MKHICVFCGSRDGADPAFKAEAISSTRALVDAGYAIVYGGGDAGLMGVVADTALQAGGKVTGILPRILHQERAHNALSELVLVEDMFERKLKMFEMSDAFLVLPGGIGTFDEVLEALTHQKLGLIDKPTVFLNQNGFYEPFKTMLDSASKAGFLDKSFADSLDYVESSKQLAPRFDEILG